MCVCQSADEALVDLRVCSDVMVNEGNALIDFFCEDKETFTLDECFHIFQNFCSKFKKAIQVKQTHTQTHTHSASLIQEQVSISK